MSSFGTLQTSRQHRSMSAFGSKADMGQAARDVAFWTRSGHLTNQETGSDLDPFQKRNIVGSEGMTANRA
jgi:hypothetical protein